MPVQHPFRIFNFSDCHGGVDVRDPFTSPDAAARIAEALRSHIPGVYHFDTFGASETYYDHIVREVFRLVDENPGAGTTGLFINNAPRVKSKNNSEPFYLAEFENGLRVVTTPLRALSAIKRHVKRLWVLPNEENGLFDGKREQHRSSYAPILLAVDHKATIVEVDPSAIPDMPKNGWILMYADRFGNMVVSDPTGASEKSSFEIIGERVPVRVGLQQRSAITVTSLSQGDPGTLVIYENDNNIEIINKWSPDWSEPERLQNSAFSVFGRPQLGSKVIIGEQVEC